MAKKIEKVLVPLDFSEYAEKAYEFAKEQGWKVIVLHVLEEGLLERIYSYFSAPGFDFEDFVRERNFLSSKGTALQTYTFEGVVVFSPD